MEDLFVIPANAGTKGHLIPGQARNDGIKVIVNIVINSVPEERDGNALIVFDALLYGVYILFTVEQRFP